MSATDKGNRLKEEANKLAESCNSDILIFNFEIIPPVDTVFIRVVSKRMNKRDSVILFLTTEGGNADSAFRMMRILQNSYKSVTVVVAGWCKSAGTLMCIGAHRLLIGELGELGPLDVQIVKADEMDEQKSGLVAEAAFEKLQQETFKFFMNSVRDIGSSEYRVTLKTASEIAAKLTVGVIQPIFDKLDPVTIGEDTRSNRLAQAYAERLNSHAKNLLQDSRNDALTNLLSGYPSHGFVIDRTEAESLFKQVGPVPDEMVPLLGQLGGAAIIPRSSRQGSDPRLEFLNDEAAPDEKNTTRADSKGDQSGRKDNRVGNGAADIPRNSKARGESGKANDKANAPAQD